MAAGKYADAEMEYRKSVQEAPNFAEGYYRLGVLRYQLRKGNEALDALEQAATLDPGNDRYGVELASVAIEAYQSMPAIRNLYDQAAKEADHLLQKDPNSFDGLRLRGEVWVVDRKYDDALAEFRKADRIRPNDPDLVLVMVQTLLAESDGPGAEALAQRFLSVRKDFPPIYDVLEGYYVRSKRSGEAEHLLQAEISALPRNAHARLELAGLYRSSGRDREMSQELEKITGDRNAFPAGPALVGDFYAESGRWNDALDQYRAGIQHAPEAEKTGYHKRMERALEALGNRQGALGELQAILKASPDDEEMRLRRAILLRESPDAKDRDFAIEELKLLAGQYPDDAVVHYNLAASYWAKGEAGLAWREAMQSSDLGRNYVAPRLLMTEIAQREHNSAAALEAAQQVIAIDPKNVAAHLVRARLLMESKSYGQAESELNAISAAQSGSKDVDLEFAELAAAEKKYAKAEALYRRVYSPGSSDLRPLEGLTRLYMLEGQPAKANALLQEELLRHPDSRPIRILLASAAAKAGKFDLALEQYRWLESKDPKSAQTYVALGEFYQLQGKTQDALASYQTASELAPNDPNILNAMAILESNSGQAERAVQTLSKQLALDPDNAAAMNNLAFNLAETGQNLDRALTLAETVARKFPSEPGVIDTLGWVYVQRGLDQSAIRVLGALVKKHPNVAAYHYHLGVALLRGKQTRDAKRELLAALSEHPPSGLSDKIRSNLKQVR